jgi:GTP cyclohydrolase IA
MSPTALTRQMALVDPPETDEAGRRIDADAAQHAAADLLVALGADLSDEGLRETPRRMVAAYTELLTSQQFRPTTFANDDGYDELVLVRSIPFHSLCMHHLLPFHGVVHIGYLPGDEFSDCRSSLASSSSSPATSRSRSASRCR